MSIDTAGLSRLIHALGHRVTVSPARPEQERVTLSIDDFDLVWRTVNQLGRYFIADSKVEYGVISFDLQNKIVQELRDARAAIDADVLEFIGWEPE